VSARRRRLIDVSEIKTIKKKLFRFETGIFFFGTKHTITVGPDWDKKKL
jgi:hypothetical protein